jgi:hypothetical protein
MVNQNGTPVGFGSGCFLTGDGLAVTNYHVVQGRYGGTVTTTDGKKYPIEGIYAADPAQDLALIKVGGTGHSALELGDSDKLRQGESVYAIGSPLGLRNTLTAGIVSNPKQELEGKDGVFIQHTAEITFGNSGGALLNRRGQVVGVNAFLIESTGATMYFAVPINLIASMARTNLQPLAGLDLNAIMYPGCTRAMDFGAFSGARRTSLKVRADGSVTALYSRDDIEKNFDYVVKAYGDAMTGKGMTRREIENGWQFSGGGETVELTVSGGVVQLVTTVKPKYYADYAHILDFGWFSGLPRELSETDDNVRHRVHIAYGFTPESIKQWLSDYYYAALRAGGFTEYVLSRAEKINDYECVYYSISAGMQVNILVFEHNGYLLVQITTVNW